MDMISISPQSTMIVKSTHCRLRLSVLRPVFNMVGGSVVKITYKRKVQQMKEQAYKNHTWLKKKRQKQMEAFYANVAA